MECLRRVRVCIACAVCLQKCECVAVCCRALQYDNESAARSNGCNLCSVVQHHFFMHVCEIKYIYIYIFRARLSKCIYMSLCICIQTCKCVHIYTWNKCVQVDMHIFLCTCMFVFRCMHAYTYLCIYKQTYTHAHTIYVYPNTHTWVCALSLPPLINTAVMFTDALCVAVCCSVVEDVAVRVSCRGLQDVAVCCSCHVHGRSVCCSVLQCVVVCRNVSELQLVAEYCSVLQLACSSTLYVLQWVAVWVSCSELRRVATCCSWNVHRCSVCCSAL